MASTGCWVFRCLRGIGQIKEMCRQMFLEGSNWNGRTDRHREVVPERRGTRVKSSCTCAGLDPEEWRTNSFAWYQWTGWKWWGQHRVRISRLLFMKSFVGQQTDFEQYSKVYWQPMEGTKQCKTASERKKFKFPMCRLPFCLVSLYLLLVICLVRVTVNDS